MRKLLLPLLLVMLVFTAAAQNNNKIYYYYKGEKVYFPVSNDRLVVGIAPGRSFGQLKSTVARAIAIAEDSLQETTPGKQFIIKLGRNKVKDITPLISKLKQNAGVSFARPVFVSPSGKYNSYGEEFIVNLKASTSYAAVQALMQQTGCTLVRKYPFQDDMYILAAGAAANYDGLAMANQFYETGLFDYAEPNKVVYDALHVAPNDPLYPLQWAHQNTGSAAQYSGTAGADMKVQQAWSITMGSNTIKIGVIDDGVDLTHPDLQANLLQGFHGGTMTSNPGDGAPTYAGDAHGTNCAGIMAAIANNGIGVAGIAPNCKIIPAVIFGGSTGAYLGDAAVAASFDYVRMSGADVISNSWGGGSVSSTIDDAIHRAVTLGRAGKGCVVLFSSGNDNGAVSYPATNPEVISVGGISMCNQRKSPTSCDGEDWGANYGTGLDVVAPCVKIASTDIQGTGGYNTVAGTAGNYFNTFNGTSSACPNAAGVVALLLSANGSLTEARARQILEQSCDKIAGYTFSTNAAQPNGTWNNELGHGRVNALTAVQSATCNQPTITAVAVTQSACPSPSSSIVVTATGTGTIEYSLDGSVYQLSNTFTNVLPGTYYLRTRFVGVNTNCVQFYNGNPVVMTKPALNIAFTAPVVTEPVCPSPVSGSIVVNATSTNPLEYSLDGVTYQSSNTFTGLRPGSYNITARLQGTTHCVESYAGNPVNIKSAFFAQFTTSYTGPAVAIPDGNPTGVDIPLTVNGNGTFLTDLNFKLDADPAGTCSSQENNNYASVTHSWVGDLVFTLTSPSGTKVKMINQIMKPTWVDGSGGNNFCTVTLDDDGSYPPIEDAKMQPIAGNFSPNEPLSAFVGEDPNGTWTLNVSDRSPNDAGSVRRFSLVIQTELTCPTVPTLVANGKLHEFTVCSGSASDVQSFTIVGAALTEDVVLTAPAGYEISTNEGTGYDTSLTLSQLAGNLPETTIYCRISAAASAGPTSGDISITSGTAVTLMTLNGTVKPTPVATATPASQTIVSGSAISIDLSSAVTGTTFIWTRDNPVVTGIRTTGVGNISGSLTNLTDTPVVVKFTIIPKANGCTGLPIIAEVTVNPTPVIQAWDSVVITAENARPANNITDPNETVTLTLPLINLGGINTANLVATLQPTGGVANPSGAQNYGVVVTGGPAVAKPFTLTATGNCGEFMTLTLALQDGARDLGTVTYKLRLGSNGAVGLPLTFANTTPILIPSGPSSGTVGAASNPYPSTIPVSGITGGIAKITVSLKQLSHTRPGDLDILLVSPSGRKMIIMSDAGATFTATNLNFVFDDAATGFLPESAGLSTGTYRPTNNNSQYTNHDVFPAPAPAGPYFNPGPAGTASFTSAFDGTEANGDWQLYVSDDLGGAGGQFNGGWSITITPYIPICSTVPVPALSINDVTKIEGGAGTTSFDFTVSLSSPAPAGGVHFDIATADNTAKIANNDYVPQSLTGQTILAGSSIYHFTVLVNGDQFVEPTETFYVNVTNVTGATVSRGQAAGIILNDDLCPAVSVVNPVVTTGTAGTTFNQTFTMSYGTTGYVYTTSSTLPPGLTLSDAGVLSGVPLQLGSFPITVTATHPKGCTETSATYTLVISCPTLSVNTPTVAPSCSGGNVSVTFTGPNPNATYNWTNNTPSIGLASGGSGNIAPFTATNSSNIPVTATLTVTPVFTYSNESCSGTPANFTITVNPIPNVLVTAPSQASCSGAPITTIVNNGNVVGTTYDWTRDNNATVTGIPASGSGNIAGSLTNTTNAPVTVTFTVTPTANGCVGRTATATVVVNPIPNAVATPAAQTICSKAAVTTIQLTGAVAGTAYNWTRDNNATVTGIAATSSGNIAGSFTNTTNAPVTVTFAITPTANGCPGTPSYASVIVNPTTIISAAPISQTIYALNNTSFSVTATGVGLTYRWQESTDGVTFNAISDGGVYAGTETNTLVLTNVPYTLGGYKYRCVVSGSCSTLTSTAATLTVNRRPVVITYTGDNTEQYSDQQTLAAIVKDQLTNAVLTGKAVTFTIGSQSISDGPAAPGNGTDASGMASALLRLYQNPGSYTVASVFTGDATYMPASDNDAFTITKENAIADYTGPEFINVPCATCATTTILLTASIRDTTAAYPLNDIYPGDIRKARVKFVNLNTLTDITGWLTPGLVNAADTTRGLVSYSWTVSLPNSGYDVYSVAVLVDGPASTVGNYIGKTEAVINVSRNTLSEFITGGGNIIPAASSGQYASDPGRKVNFGFNVKYNRSGTNLQGSLNTIFRRAGRVYQIKATAITGLSVNATNPCSTKAIFSSKANLLDITNPLQPVSVYGGITLNVTMTDNGDAGSADMIGMTLMNGNNLVFSSNWVTTQTNELVLNSGNLIVHSGVTCPDAIVSSKTAVNATVRPTDKTPGFTVSVYPNPSSTDFAVMVNSNSEEPVAIHVMDASGKVLETHTNAANGKAIRVAGQLKSGFYFAEILQGKSKKILKLVKLK